MDQPNVLLVILDSVRAKNVGHHGYPRDTTPRLDELTERATMYVNARAPGIHSISSHASLFTGLEVAEHHATSHGTSLEPGHTIWEELTNKGYRTGLFTPNAIVAESSNLGSFFETVVGPKRQELVFPDAVGPAQIKGNPSYKKYLEACIRSDSPVKGIINGLAREFGHSTGTHDPTREHAGEYIDAFQKWREGGTQPWAACINLMDAHYPYIPLEPYRRWGTETLEDLHRKAMGGPLTTQYLSDRPFWELEATESLYDDCIRQVDDHVGKLIDELDSTGILDETLIVVTSDHGEGFGEYSNLNDEVRLIDHSWGIGDEVSHVPLVARSPGQQSSKTVTAPASLTQFPNVVRQTLKGKPNDFVPDKKYAITTSYRIQEPGDELPLPVDEREPYFGPWHAVCRQEDRQVIVDAIRREDEFQHLPTHGNVSRPVDREYIETILEELANEEITQGDDEIDDEVEQRLHELGYIS